MTDVSDAVVVSDEAASSVLEVSDAALFFVDGQYLLRYRERSTYPSGQGRWSMKHLSPSAVRAALANEPIDTGWLPYNMRRAGSSAQGDWCVMFFPPDRYTVHVRLDDEVKDVDIPLPGLIFAGRCNAYYLWAAKTAKFSPEVRLCRAPLPNIDHSGCICFGANFAAKVTCESMPEMWHLLWDSVFNSHTVADKSRAHPKDVRQQLLAAADKVRYPLRDLVPTNVTVSQWVERWSRDKSHY